MEISIRSNVNEMLKTMTFRQKAQMPYITATAINNTLFQIRKPLIKKLRLAQKSNKAWWKGPKGVRIKKANKKQPIISGSIGTNIYWAHLQEKGGVKRPFKSRNIPVPTGNVPKKYRKAGGARQFINDRKGFVLPTKSGKVIFTRKGKAKKLTAAFNLEPQATIRKNLGFVKWADRLTRRVFAKNHRAAMQRALRTMR